MKTYAKAILAGLLFSLLAVNANAANVAVNANIAASTTWTANNVYNLVGQIYVLPGATLTIEAGTLIKNAPADLGSIAVCRGAKIFVNGTATAPVIMTSTLDTMTAWHEGCNEWGNLTIMGKGVISASSKAPILGRQNTAIPDGLNQAGMEGLVPADGNDTKTLYGGNDDNDDSGSIHYLSLRYGGKVIGLANELNGLSLGGIGRETDIDHVEIMNNVDDGIEIWGGTVNLKYISIWNIGDDCFDIDEGWRGKAQFGLLVQGYSVSAAQGSGVGDNCFEIDGAEDSDAQPVTTGVIYNFTAIGQPIDGDQGIALRDNANVQFRNCIFMDIGEMVVKNDNMDGDGAHGYGYNGTLSFAERWTTPYTTHSSVNAMSPVPAVGAFNHPDTLYQAQTSGTLLEVSDCVFYNNLFGQAYTTADSVNVRAAANNNVTAAAGLSPIQGITRGAVVTKGGMQMLPVTLLNPCAANDALTSVNAAPADGFFTPAKFRGAFSANNNWLKGWTAADAYGMTVTTMNKPDPDATIKMTTSTSFATEVGVVYSVEASSDMKNWAPIQTVVGTGSTMSVTDLKSFDAAKFYRVVRQ